MRKIERNFQWILEKLNQEQVFLEDDEYIAEIVTNGQYVQIMVDYSK